MKVTYLNHSGFLVEWPDCYWLFDYFKGSIPELDADKKVFVFVSHSHGDHFNPKVFELAKKYPQVQYIFSNEIRSRLCGKHAGEKYGEIPEITFLTVGADAVFSDGREKEVRVHTLHSTDCGCAFVLRYEGKTVYHAGDLHWWARPGEPEKDNRKMIADYKKEMEYLTDTRVDLAFTPLDPRQGETYADGMNYFLKTVQTVHVFPMHFWDDFSVIERFLKEQQVPENTRIYKISRDGQMWNIDLENAPQ